MSEIPDNPRDAIQYTKKSELKALWLIVIQWALAVVMSWADFSRALVAFMLIANFIAAIMWVRMSYIGKQLRNTWQDEIGKQTN